MRAVAGEGADHVDVFRAAVAVVLKPQRERPGAVKTMQRCCLRSRALSGAPNLSTYVALAQMYPPVFAKCEDVLGPDAVDPARMATRAAPTRQAIARRVNAR